MRVFGEIEILQLTNKAKKDANIRKTEIIVFFFLSVFRWINKISDLPNINSNKKQCMRKNEPSGEERRRKE